MKLFRYGLLSLVIGLMLFVAKDGFAYTHTILQPISWPGEKWEYLVEHPVSIHHVDVVEFEEICDSAGMHGWKLIEVSDAFHFYTFYFARPLLPHKIGGHVARLARLKAKHEADEAGVRYRIQTQTASKAQELQQKEKEAVKEGPNQMTGASAKGDAAAVTVNATAAVGNASTPPSPQPATTAQPSAVNQMIAAVVRQAVAINPPAVPAHPTSEITKPMMTPQQNGTPVSIANPTAPPAAVPVNNQTKR